MATCSELFAMAVEHHQGGRLQSAEAFYRQILQEQPDHADALHLLGVLAHQVGQHKTALELISRSIQLDGTAANVHNNLGGVYRALKMFPEAVACHRRALELRPGYAEACINLGHAFSDLTETEQALICYRRAAELRPDSATAHAILANALNGSGQRDEAIECYRRVLELQPDHIETHINLGNALKDSGDLDQAIACYRQVLRVKPDFVVAHLNLGVVLNECGQHAEAIACYRQAITLQPNFSEAYNNLGIALADHQELSEAETCYRRAIELKPDYADAFNNLGNVLISRANPRDAVICFQRALELQPGFAKAHNNLGVAFKATGQHDEAVDCFQLALKSKPEYTEACTNLAATLKAQGKLDQAEDWCRHALRLNPNDSQACNHLGNILKDRGKVADSIEWYRRAIALKADDAAAHSNLIYTQLFCPGYDRRALSEEHRRWNQTHAASFEGSVPSYLNDRSPNRRLRIGYVSPDFRNHVVGRNLLPLFREHDHQQFEILCYSDAPCSDELTERFRSFADVFRETAGMSDSRLAKCVRQDQIDILVDLTLHMAQNRLLMFARKPAPIQVTFAGYPGSTGLTAMDYRLTDPYLDPPAQFDDAYSERSIRLPHSFWCYDPIDSVEPTEPLPALENGYVTFGCLNNFCKVNPPVLELWGRVLNSVEGSRLILLAAEGSHRADALDVLTKTNVDPARVTFVSNLPRQLYLRNYHGIDIGLDTVPYNGHSTSLDSYWMGVPVVTLVGPTVVGRAGLSQLMNLGLPDLIALDPDQYVRIAKELAADLPRLAELRATLRERMQRSPLMDAKKFAAGIQAAYRKIWPGWCDNERQF